MTTVPAESRPASDVIGKVARPVEGAELGLEDLERDRSRGLVFLDESRPELRHDGGMGIAAIATDVLGLLPAAVLAAALAASLHRAGTVVFDRATFASTLLRLLASIPVFVAALAGTRHDKPMFVRTGFGHQVNQVALPVAAGGLLCLAGWRIAAGSGVHVVPTQDSLIVTALVGIGMVATARLALHSWFSTSAGGPSRVVVVGSGVVAERVRTQLQEGSGVEVVGFVDDEPKEQVGWLGHLCELHDVCDRFHIDRVVVAFSRSSAEEIVAALRPVQGRLPISVVPRLFDVVPTNAYIHELSSGFPAVSVMPATLGIWPRALKRSVDVAGAGLGLLVASPLLLAIAVAVRLSSRGPVILRQTRIGRHGQSFSMLKFRTMWVQDATTRHPAVPAEPVQGPFPKLKSDPRVTPIGRILRRCSLDELPQLVNVLTGSMSLVGPRPFVPDDAAWIDGWALRRYSARPGITGLWQVSGRNDLTYEEMCRLDHLYVSSWSIGLDVRILVRTLRAMVAGRGAY